MGWLCAYTPEELVLASGLTPLRLVGCEERPLHASLLPSNLCPYVRSVLDEAEGGRGQTLAAVSFVASCDAMRRLADVWRMRFPGTPVHVIDSPRRRDRAAEFFNRYEHLIPRKAGASPRLVVTGSIIESESLFQAVEEAGANVVAEDICTGLRGTSGLVEEEGIPIIRIETDYQEGTRGQLATTLLDYVGRKRPVVWTTYTFPTELITAYSMVPYFSETGSAVIASLGYGGTSLEITEKRGYGRESCTYHRATMGATFEGYLPEPDLLVGCSHLCDGQAKMMESMAEHYGKPSILLDVPYYLTDDSIACVAEQLAGIEEAFAQICGRRAGKGRLEEVISSSNRTRRAMLEVNALRKHTPSPMYGRWAFGFIFQALLGMGSPEVLSLYERLARELRGKIENGPQAEQERRILWLLAYPSFTPSFVDYMEEELGLYAVADEMRHVYWDEMGTGDPLRELARKTLQNHGLGEVERRVRVAVRLAAEYNVEGAIHYSHFGCRQGCGGVSAFREGLEEAGTPLLVLDGDCIDERNYSDSQVRTRLEGYCEMLRARRQGALLRS
jgi:benzoyl-CoA reductase/2-hydroxyglutaryl-CoA dehydratase subunit BcrC/BadD/HgdB